MKSALFALAAVLFACGARPASAPPAAAVQGDVLTADEVEKLAAAYLAAGAAFGRSDFGAAATAFHDAAQINRGDDGLAYQQAAALAAGGRHDEALIVLDRLAAQRTQLIPQARDFPGVDPERLTALAAKIRAGLPPTRSKRVAVLPERDLIAEGVTLDTATHTFYVGSIHRRKVVAVGPDGTSRDLITSAADDLYSPLGMRHDPRRGSLWIASSALPEMQGFDPALHKGRAALHEHDATTGRLRARYPRDTRRPHLLNDLAIDARGQIYVSDSEAGEVLLLAPGPDAQFEVLVPAGELFYPNGVALSDDDSTLFVADFVRGVTAIRLATRARVTLPHPRGASTRGIDGLYFHRGALIAVDNGAGAGRIVRLELAATLDRVLATRVLEAGHPSFEIPTTGTLDGDALVYIANSQLRSFTDGKIFPPEQLRPTELLRVPLTP
jgi:hypothetical protein